MDIAGNDRVGYATGESSGPGLLDTVGNIAGAVLPGAKWAIDNIAGPVLQYIGVKQSNATSLQSAREQMAFQERMSDTAHQREIADMIKAGINPIMSVDGGRGASTPEGAAYTAQNPFAGISDFINKKRENDIAEQRAQYENRVLESQQQLNSAQAAKEQSEVRLNNGQLIALSHQIAKTDAEKDLASSTDAKNMYEMLLTDREQERLGLQMQRYRNDDRFEKSWFGKNIMPWIRGTQPEVNNASSFLTGYLLRRPK